MCRELLVAGRWADVLQLAEAASSAAPVVRLLDRHVLIHEVATCWLRASARWQSLCVHV